MAGKYSTVIEGLLPAPVEVSERQSRIDRLKAEIKTLAPTVQDVAKGYEKARAQKAELEGLLKEVHEEIDAHSQLLIESCQAKEKGWGQYGAADNMLRLPNGTTIRIDKEPGVTVVDPEKFRLWCVANGLEQALRLWPSTTESLTKERLVAGAPPPDGIDVSYFFEKIVYKKG